MQDVSTSLVKWSTFVDTANEVVESLIFFYKQSILFFDHPDNAREISIEKELMSILVESTIKFDNVDLNKLMAIHLNFIGTQCVKNF